MPVEPTLKIGSASTSDMTHNVTDYSVDTKNTDGATGQDETTWQNPKWSQYYGYYTTIPELKKAIDALATWTLGKGYTSDSLTQVQLESIKGWGEDTFESICWNLFVTKKINGDAFAEVIRDPETDEIINLKPLDPGSIKIVADKKGIIKRYEQTNKLNKGVIKFQPDEILHLCNERVADNIHGESIISACEWTILARNEAMTDWKTVLHRNIHPLKIWHLDTDDATLIAAFKTKVETCVNDKENIFIPKGNVEVEIPATVLQEPTGWIKYLENFFYQAVGVPKIILGGSEEFTESSSKIAYLTFMQIYLKEQREFESDLWNQLQIKITFNKPASLQNELLTDESKDGESTGGMNFQPDETQMGAV
jgi:hypothetical protein